MSLPRFFLESALPSYQVGGEFVLDLHGAEKHHMRVLRLAPGEHIVAVDNTGAACELELTNDDVMTPQMRFIAALPFSDMPRVTLVQGVSKGARMELTIRQATELGVAAIIPLLSQRCVVHLEGDRRALKGKRWRKIVQAAAKQAGCSRVPVLTDPVDLDESLAMIASCDVVLCAWEESDCGSIRAALADVVASGIDSAETEGGAMASLPHVALYVGPEGGFTADEVTRLKHRGVRVVSLGDTILRTETAGVVGSALVIYELGGLGNGACNTKHV